MINLTPSAPKMAVRTLIILPALALLLLLPASAFGQKSTDGATPSGLAPGAPAGSYALSGFDNVNLFNGHLNLQLPLVGVGGRGAAGYRMTLPVEQTWTVWTQTNEITHVVTYHPEPNWWEGIKPGYSPGVLQGRKGGDGSSYCAYTGPTYTSTLTRLTFTGADGTEFELRDQLTGGQPQGVLSCGYAGFNRGKVFITADGSSATFVSDADILDYIYVSEDAFVISPSGYLMLKDGTRYRVDGGVVSWVRDRNGNKLTFTNDTYYHRVTAVTDSLGRQITISYATQTPGSDVITYKGFGQADRTVSVNYDYLQNALRSDQTLKTPQQLFPELNGSSSSYYNPIVIKSVTLPNSRQYQLFYDSYGEPARVVLPTGGAFEYDYMAGITDGYADGVIGTGARSKAVLRRVVERREYPDGAMGTSYASKMTYSRPETGTTNAGYVITDQCTPSGTMGQCGGSPALLARQYHYFYGSARSSFHQKAIDYSAWNDGREYQTDVYGSDGSTLLRRMTNTFAQRAAVVWWANMDPNVRGPEPPNDPRLVETISTLADTNQVAKQTFGYSNDLHNNQTDVWEYDYGVGGASAYPTRHTHTDYLIVNSSNGVNYADPANGASYTSSDIHIRNLPRAQQAYSVNATNGAETLVAQGETKYDESAYPLLTYAAVAGWDDPGAARGSATTSRSWLDTTNIWLESHAQYDQVGNVRSAWDAKGNLSQVSYADSFSDGVSRNTYALPTSTTSAVPDTTNQRGTNTPLTSSTVYDYSTGALFSSTDANDKTTTAQYNDVLDRLTRVDRPDGGRTTYTYVDQHQCGPYVESRTLIDTSGRETDGFQFFDGLGRGVRSFSYDPQDTNNPYVTSDTQYDVLGRVQRVSNPYRSSGCTSAVNPSGRWTTTSYDALGRALTVTTPDNAVVTTSYAGNQVTVTDQAGKQRRSVSDGLGRLTQVVEDSTSGGLNYATNYTYDALGNLRKVDQGGQQRFFMYDSLSRLIRAKNPEQTGSISADADFPALTDSTSGTSNSQWSMGYTYDANGNLYKRKDARNVTTTYQYDNLNRNTTTDYSDTSVNPDAEHAYDMATNGRGRFWYDIVTAGTNGSHNAVDSYDAAGHPLVRRQLFATPSDIGGGVYWRDQWWGPAYQMSSAYNLAGGVTSQTYPSGRTVNNSYDGAGRLKTFTGNLGDGTARTYATGVNPASGVEEGIQYDEAGRMREEKFGTTTPLFHKLHYNVRGQLYDVRLSSVGWGSTNGEWNWNRGALLNYYSQAEINAPTNEGHGLSGVENNGNLKRASVYVPTDPNGAYSDAGAGSYYVAHDDYAYDSLNRLSSVGETNNAGAGSLSQGYTYDRWGNRQINAAATSAGINSRQFTIDTTTNRLTASGMAYDNAGNLTQDTYSASAAQRSYDAENRMTMEQNSATSIFSRYTYDADGRRTRRDLGGVVTWQVYGFDGELVAEYAGGALPNQPQKEYGYRGGELLVTAGAGTTSSGTAASAVSDFSPTQNPAGAWAYGYRAAGGGAFSALTNNDNIYGLTSGMHTWYLPNSGWNLPAIFHNGTGTVQTYSTITQQTDELNLFPGPSGERTVVRWTAAAAMTVLVAGSFEGLDSQGATSDAAVTHNTTQVFSANVTGSGSGSRQTFSLTRTVAAGDTLEFSVGYGANGTVSGDSTGLRVTITPQATSADIEWLVSDHLGTPRMVVDQTGSLAGVKRHDYLPFGEEVGAGTGGRTAQQGYNGNADGNRKRWAELERDDETGLDYAQARYYANTQGRFTSVDPENYQAMRDPSDPQSWNAYAYVNNNPLTRNDPDGRGLLTKLWNKFKYGVYGEEADVQKEENRRREELKKIAATQPTGLLYVQQQDNSFVAYKVANLSRDEVFDLSSGNRSVIQLTQEQAKDLLSAASIIPLGFTPNPGVPQRAQDTLDHVEKTGKPPSGQQGGRTFSNDGRSNSQLLPKTDANGKPINYKEYDVNGYTKGVDRGGERIVRGSDGSAYYTSNHYQNFIRIK